MLCIFYWAIQGQLYPFSSVYRANYALFLQFTVLKCPFDGPFTALKCPFDGPFTALKCPFQMAPCPFENLGRTLCTMINKSNLAAYKCAIFQVKLLYYLSFVDDCKMKTLCQKMLKFCTFLSDLQRNRFWQFEQILRRLSSNLSWNVYVLRGMTHKLFPKPLFLVKYWLKFFYFITFSNLGFLY